MTNQGYTLGQYYSNPSQVNSSNFHVDYLGNANWQIVVPGFSDSQIGFYRLFDSETPVNVGLSANGTVTGTRLYFWVSPFPPNFNGSFNGWGGISNQEINTNGTFNGGIPAGYYFGFGVSNNGNPVTISLNNVPPISQVQQSMFTAYLTKQAINENTKSYQITAKNNVLEEDAKSPVN
jgi:hypothetical protein